jgi:hypothetical protein
LLRDKHSESFKNKISNPRSLVTFGGMEKKFEAFQRQRGCFRGLLWDLIFMDVFKIWEGVK